MSQSMSTSTSSGTADRLALRPQSRPALALIAIAASAVHALAMVPAYLAGEEFRWNEFAVLMAISLVVSLAIFLGAVPRGGSRTAVVLAVLAVVSVGAFWALLTLPLAGAAATVALRRRAADGTPATVALGLSALAAVLLAVAIAVSS